jgi:hypothetical protein
MQGPKGAKRVLLTLGAGLRSPFQQSARKALDPYDYALARYNTQATGAKSVAEAQAALDKPELAEEQGALRERLQTDRDNATAQRTADIIAGQNQRESGRESSAQTLESQKESAAEKLQRGRPVTMDQLAAQAEKEGDNATLAKIQSFKEQIAKAGKQEAGNFIPVNDAQGNTLGWADPKSRDWVPVSSIAGGAPGQAAGGPGGVIPPKPPAGQAAGIQNTQAALDYAQTYLKSGKFTGPADEALMESFFEVAKPSSGFRMSQPQIDMLVKGRSWMDSAEGLAYHAKNGVWFPPDQRQQIVDAMSMKAASKQKFAGAGNTGAPTSQPPATGGGFAAWKASQAK